MSSIIEFIMFLGGCIAVVAVGVCLMSIVPEYLKLKVYRIFGNNAEDKENTVVIKYTLWSIISYNWWLPVLFIFILVMMCTRLDGDENIIALFCLLLVGLPYSVLMTQSTITLNGYGITTKKHYLENPNQFLGVHAIYIMIVCVTIMVENGSREASVWEI